MARHKTKFTGIFYRDSVTNDKPDKTYYIVFKDNAGKMREVKIGKHSEGVRENYCNQKRNEILTKQRLGEEPPAIARLKQKEIMPFDVLAQQYFLDKETKNRSNSQSKNRYENLIKPMIGTKSAEKMTQEDIEKVEQDLLKTRAPKTVNWYIQLLNAIFNHAIKKQIFKLPNPCKFVPALKHDNARERYLTKEEIEDLLCELEHDKELTLFTKLSLTTGGRLETILHIQKKDIDFSNGVITLKDLKNNDTYRGFLSKKLSGELKKWTTDLKPNDKIISSSNRTISRKMKKVLDELFNEDLEADDAKNRAVIHTLRHTFASHLAINGTPIFTIQKLMNHKDIQQTLRYAKLAPDSGKDAVIQLWHGM